MEACILSYFVQNDELISSCDFNQSLLNQGLGIYEVIRIIDGKPLFLEEHVKRFLNSAKHEKFGIELSATDLRYKIRILIEQNKMHTGNIRFQYIQNKKTGNLFLAWAIPFHYPSKTDLANGVKIKTINAIRENPHSKRTNLPVRQIADKMIDKDIISEVLLLNSDGLITEGSRSNIFFIRKNQLLTPLSSLVLEGITREKIILVANENKMEVSEEKINIKEINFYDSCFISSTSKSVLPVRQIDNVDFNVNNLLMDQLSKSYNKQVDQYLSVFEW